MKKVSGLIKLITVIAVMISQLQCGTKETVKNEVKGYILFLIGGMEVVRAGNSISNLKHGDVICDGDILKTGDKSQVTIQIGDRGCIRISQNTEVKIVKLYMKKETEIFLEKGEVISKVLRLLKDEKYSISTRAIKAAVRGTTFSVSSSNNEEYVAVLKGQVQVTVDENKPKVPVKETYLKEGEMAAVRITGAETERKEIKMLVLSVDKTRLNDLEKTDLIEIIPDIENVKADELKTKQQEMLKNEENLDKEREKLETGSTSKIDATTIEQLIKQKTRTLEEIKKVNGRIDEINLNSGEVLMGAIISRGNIYSVLTTKGVINVSKKEISTIKVIK